jgi:hypothetical protein
MVVVQLLLQLHPTIMPQQQPQHLAAVTMVMMMAAVQPQQPQQPVAVAVQHHQLPVAAPQPPQPQLLEDVCEHDQGAS